MVSGGPVHHIDHVLCFYDFHISSASDHQALDPSGWGPPLCMVSSITVSIAAK